MNNVHFAIPEIYGETLSYYELLRKLVDKTNDLIDNYNTVPEQIAEEVKNLDASKLFGAVLNQLIHSIATDNTKSANAVKVYKKHDLLYATFNDTVNLYESLIDFTTVTETELIVGTNIREVNISELFIELRKLIDINKNNIASVTAVANENSAEIITIHNDITSIENKNTEQDNELSTLRTMLSSPYNFKGEVASISALPSTGNVNDTYYVQDVKYKVTWTGSEWVQSSLSEADYQKELSELQGDIVDIETISNEYLISKNANLLNINDTGVEIGYYNTENGDFVSNDNALTSAFIPYDNNSTYSASYPTNWFNYLVSLWDVNKNFIKLSIDALPITKTDNHFTLQPTTYSNAKYIKFTIFNMDKDFTTAMVVKDMAYPSEYIPYGYHYTDKNNEHIADIVLHLPKHTIFDNKVLLFTGDSICYGANWRPTVEDYSNTGWRKIIQEDYPKSVTYGYGIGGTTITKREGRTDSILERMNTMFSEHPAADYIIIQGGVNDAYNITDCPIGTISTGYTAELNENTFAGALESIFKYAQTNWLGKKIGYIVTFKVPSAMGQFKFNEYMDIAKQICEKWSVPYCDLYNESNLNYYIQEVSNAYGGGLHPNEAGYRIITNKIEKWLETL